MQTNQYIIGTALLCATLLTSCGGSREEKTNDEASVSTVGALSAMKEMGNQAEEMQKNGNVETVDFRQLKELLPNEVDGLARKEATGEKNGTAGFTISTAVGKYGNTDDSETIEITLIDGGGSPMMMGLAAWSMIDVDKETEHGYEKTSTMGGNKSYEKYDNADKSGELAVFVNKRYVVTAKGHGVGMDKIKSALEDLDLKKLAELK